MHAIPDIRTGYIDTDQFEVAGSCIKWRIILLSGCAFSHNHGIRRADNADAIAYRHSVPGEGSNDMVARFQENVRLSEIIGKLNNGLDGVRSWSDREIHPSIDLRIPASEGRRSRLS